MPDPIIGAGFNSDIAYRYKPGQTQAEFYSQKTGQAFGDANQLASYVNANFQGANANEGNVFGVLAGGYTPRAQALDQVKNELNTFQNNTFAEQSAPKRQSSSLTEKIAAEDSTINDALTEFNTLKTKLTSLQAPSYEQAYNDLRTAQGVPQLESDLAANNKAIRELPYVNRMNSGNAGVETEGQLAADTQQKGIPLEIQQGNLLDHLKLAQDFINNSLKLKEQDYNSSREGIATAIDLVSKTLEMSRQHLADLTTKDKEQKNREELAQKFAFENRITKPFYDIGGTVYRTSDRMPAHDQAEYVALGGTGDFSDVQKISPQAKPLEVNPGNTVIDPATGKVIYQAPNKPTTPHTTNPPTPTPTDPRPVKAGDRDRYNLPAYITQGEFNQVKQGISAVIEAAGGVNDENRWDLWGQVADALKELGLNPSDFDALLWDSFHPQRLAGYKAAHKTTQTTNTKKSLVDRINEIQ